MSKISDSTQHTMNRYSRQRDFSCYRQTSWSLLLSSWSWCCQEYSICELMALVDCWQSIERTKMIPNSFCGFARDLCLWDLICACFCSSSGWEYFCQSNGLCFSRSIHQHSCSTKNPVSFLTILSQASFFQQNKMLCKHLKHCRTCYIRYRKLLAFVWGCSLIIRN